MVAGLALGVPFKSKFSGTVVDPGLALLQSATLWLNAANGVAGEQTAVNQGTGGSALDARYGSTTGVDTNDPLLLTHTGTNYLYPGASGSSLTKTANNFCESSAALGGTQIDMRVRLIDIGTNTGGTAVSQLNGGFGQAASLSYTFSTRAVTSNLYTIAGTSATASIVGSLWLRMTHDFTSGDCILYESTDGSSWTQIGTSNVSATNRNGDLFKLNNSDSLARFASEHNIAYADVRQVIGGTIVSSFDASLRSGSDTSWTDAQGKTWTLNRAASGRKAVMVTRPVWLFGTDDYMEIADNALLDFAASQDFTVVAILRRWGSGYTSTAGIAVGKQAAGGVTVGWRLGYDTTDVFAFSDGSVQSYQTQTPVAAGTASLLGGVRNVTSDTVGVVKGSTITTATDTTTGSMDTSTVLQIGRYANATPFYVDAEIIAVAVFRSALTSTQLGQIATYYGV